MGVIFALISAISWGISNALVRKAQINTTFESDVGTFITILINNIVNITILLFLLVIKARIDINLAGLLFFSLGGLFNSCIGRCLIFRCFEKVGAARGSVIKGITPLFVIGGGVFILKERMSALMWLGIGIILSGVYIISHDTISQLGSDNDNTVAGNKSYMIKNIVLGIVACGFLAGGNLFRKAGLQYINSAVIGVTTGSFTAFIVLGAYLLLSGKKSEIIKSLKATNKEYVIGGAFTSAAVYFMFISMQLIPISITNSVGSSEPLFSILVSYWMLRDREKITPQTVMGGCLIVVGGAVLIIFT